MENNVIFDQRPDEQPMIYGYTDPRYPGKIKVGYASKGIDKRVAEIDKELGKLSLGTKQNWYLPRWTLP